MSLKSRVIDIIDDEIRSKLNDRTFLTNATAANGSIGGVQTGTITSMEKDGTYTMVTNTGQKIKGIQPGSSPIGPGTDVVLLGGSKIISLGG